MEQEHHKMYLYVHSDVYSGDFQLSYIRFNKNNWNSFEILSEYSGTLWTWSLLYFCAMSIWLLFLLLHHNQN